MKITSVTPVPIWIGNRNQLLVQVKTDSGLHGWGESGLTSREQAVASAVRHYAGWLEGRDPMNIGAASISKAAVFSPRRFRRSTSPCTTSREKRWACPCGSCSAASTATMSTPSLRSGRLKPDASSS